MGMVIVALGRRRGITGLPFLMLNGKRMQNNWRETVKSLEFSLTTYEYSRWHLNELDVRGFLIASNQGMGEWFNSKWQAAQDEADRVFDPDYDDESLPYDLFIKSTGLAPEDYFCSCPRL
jgi:hypothetical protein